MINGLIGGAVVVVAWLLWQYFKKQQEEDITPSDDVCSEDSTTPRKSKKDIVVEALKRLQCDPHIKEEGEGLFAIDFEFQAKRFYLKVDESCSFTTLYDTYWYSFDSTDIEQFSLVKRIINDINWRGQVNLCYNNSEENGMTHVHTQASLLCIEEVNYVSYLRHILRECFIANNEFFRKFAESSVIVG